MNLDATSNTTTGQPKTGLESRQETHLMRNILLVVLLTVSFIVNAQNGIRFKNKTNFVHNNKPTVFITNSLIDYNYLSLRKDTAQNYLDSLKQRLYRNSLGKETIFFSRNVLQYNIKLKEVPSIFSLQVLCVCLERIRLTQTQYPYLHTCLWKRHC